MTNHESATSISLDGRWTFVPLREPLDAQTASPPTTHYPDTGPIRVPGYWNHFPTDLGGDWGAYDHYRYPSAWQDAPAGWYHTTFRARDLDHGGRAFLHFGAVAGHSTVFLNGVRLGENFDSFLPFVFDVTSMLRSDCENELWLLVQPPPQREGRWLQPPGSWTGWTLRGIWQSVWLETTPAGAIADVFAQPSVREDRLRVDITVHNHDGTDRELALEVLDGERVVLNFDRQRVSSSGTSVFRFEQDHPALDHWSPDCPRLYTLRATLSQAGRAIDRRDTPLGFREFWIEGTEFRLNGRPIRLFGDSWHYMGVCQQNPAYAHTWYDFARQTGACAIRTHAMPYPPCYFDVADKAGMLIIAETGIYGSAGTLAYDEEVFWQRCREHIRRMVLRDRHHPSIILWSATNETVWAAGERIFPHLVQLRDEAARVDPTRAISFDENDSDIGGASPVYAGHYGTVAHWSHTWKHDRPLVMHEFCTLYHGGPNDAAALGDDIVYADYAARLHAAGEDAARMFMGLRYLGAASITPWNLNWYSLEPLPGAAKDMPGHLTEGGAPLDRIGERALTLNFGQLPGTPRWQANPAYAPLAACYHRQCCYAPHAPRQGFATATYTCDAFVFNDTADSASLVLSLTLQNAEDTSAAHCPASLSPLTSAVHQLTLELPDVSTPTTCRGVLTLAHAESGDVVHEIDWPIHIHPRTAHAKGPRTVWIAGTHRSLPSHWRAVTLDTLPDDLLKSPQSTVILTDAAAGSVRTWLAHDEIRAWIEQGGRLIALPDAMANDDTSALAPIHRNIDRVHLRDRQHPAGLTADHLRDWPTPDGIVATTVMQRPKTGPAVAMLDTGNPATGLAWSPLVVVNLGQGHVVLCGMPLIDRSTDTPAAQILLDQLIQAPLTQPLAHDTTLISEDPSMGQLADEIGIVQNDRASVIIADGASANTLEHAAVAPSAIDQLLDDGGALILHNLVPGHAAEWSRRLDVKLDVVPDECFNVARANDDPLLSGLNNYDLCWVDRDQKQPITRYTMEIPRDPESHALVQTVATRWEDYQMAPEQHKVAMMYRRIDAFAGHRAAVLSIHRGRGRIIISQLLLHEATGSFRTCAQRILSRWLDALGCRRDPAVNPLFVDQQRATTAQGFIVDWLVAGPFIDGRGHPLDHSYIDEPQTRPTAAQTTADRQWLRREAAFADVDLSSLDAENAIDRVAYAATYLYSPRDRSVLLDAPDMVSILTGADGGVKVILNGSEVGRFDFVRELQLDNDRVDGLPLKKGWNTLLLKLHKRGGGKWAFAARLVTSAGEPVEDIRIQTDRPPDLD